MTLVFSLILLSSFDSRSSGPQFAFMQGGHYGLEWVGRPDIRFALGLDGLSLWLFLLTSILLITSIGASWSSIRENPGPYYAFLLALRRDSWAYSRAWTWCFSTSSSSSP